MSRTTDAVLKSARLKHTLFLAAMGLLASPAWALEEGGGNEKPNTETKITDTVTTTEFVRLVNGEYVLSIPTILNLLKIQKKRYLDDYYNNSNINQLSSELAHQTGLAGGAGDSPWSGWAAVSGNHGTYSFQPLASTSRSNNAMAGVGYSLGGGTEVGVNLGVDATDVTSRLNARSLDYRGYNVMPYFFKPLAPNWTLDGTLGFGRAKVRANGGGNVTGESRESRRFGAVGLNYFTSAGDWRMVGSGGLQTYSSKLQRFTLSDATVIAASSNHLTQLTLGGQASYGSGRVVPFVGVSYAHDLNRPVRQAVAGQTPSDARGTFSGQVGLSFRPNKQVSASLQLTTDRRSQMRNNGLQAALNVRL